MSEAVFCHLDKEHSSMLSENQSLRASSLPRVFHSGAISRRLHPPAADTAAPVSELSVAVIFSFSVFCDS